MSWEQSIHNKSQEELDASVLAQRQKVTDDYRNVLNDLEEQISKARFTLSSIQQDVGDIHDKRLKEYQALADDLKNQSYELALQAAQVKKDQDDLAKARVELNDLVAEETKRVDANTATFLANKDHYEELSNELSKHKEDQDQKEAKLSALDISLSEKKSQLEALEKELAQKDSEIIVQRQQLANDVLLHEQTIENHKHEVEAFRVEQDRNMQFHDALVAKEQGLEPLKDKYQAGIDANAKEATRLRDENIRVYAVSKDAEKRLALAIEAEKKANSQLDKLETLKTDLHESITPKES